MTGTSDTGETLQSIVIKSAAYCKKDKSPQHEFIWIQFENPTSPDVWNYMVLDRNKFGDELDPRGTIWPSIQESGSVVAQDEFRISCDGNLNKLLKRCGLAPCRTIETITFSVGHFLPLYHFAAVALATHELRNRYHLIQANCYWFAGIVWAYMVEECPNIKHVVREGTRGKFGVLFSHTTDSSELDEVRTRVQELLSATILDGAFNAHATLHTLIPPGELFMPNIVRPGGEPKDRDPTAKNGRWHTFEATIQQMSPRARMYYLRNLTDLVGEIGASRAHHMGGQNEPHGLSSQPAGTTELGLNNGRFDKPFVLDQVNSISDSDYGGGIPPDTATPVGKPRVAEGRQSMSSRVSVTESNIRWSGVSRRSNSSDGSTDGLLSNSDEELDDPAITVGDKGRRLMVDAEGRPMFQLDVQSGTTHLLLGSSPTVSVISPFLVRILPRVGGTLLCLDISNKKLTTLPAALIYCTQLEELNVSNNPLRTLPSTLGALVSLRVLIADGCTIGSLPSQLVQLRALHTLSVRSNRLVMLPVWMCAMPGLEVLKIEGNTFAGPWRNLVEPLLPHAITNDFGGSSDEEIQRRADEEITRQRSALTGIRLYLRDLSDLQGGISAIPVQSMDGQTKSGRLYASSMRAPSIARSILSAASLRIERDNVNDADSGWGSGLLVENREIKVDNSWRIAIVKAIVETEKSYVKALQELLDIYVKPSSETVPGLNASKDTTIPAAERKIVFTGVDALLQFHKQSFLPSLVGAAEILSTAGPGEDVSIQAAHAIANVFVSHAAFMKINFDNAIQRLQFWSAPPSATNTPGAATPAPNTPGAVGVGLSMVVMGVAGVAPDQPSHTATLNAGQRKRIKQFLKRCRLNPRHSQLNLEDYLILPIQRIPTYMVLLDNLVACTPPHPEEPTDPLESALEEIVILANSMNEGKRESESRTKLVQWQSRIRGKFISPLVQPHRRLIMDGRMQLVRLVKKVNSRVDMAGPDGSLSQVEVPCLSSDANPKQLVAILCNDLLVLCKEMPGAEQVELWAVLRMQTMAQPASIVSGNGLRIVDNKAILYFNTQSTSEALTWQRAINLHIPHAQ